MSDKSKIEWTDATWNPVRGCSVVSEGCRNCYAMQIAARFSGEGMPFEGLAYRNGSGAHWTGKTRLVEERLEDPLRWKAPRRIFVNSMSDLFHESLSETQIQNVFSVMESARQHVYQILTKRPTRMLEFVKRFDNWLKYASDYPGQLSFKERFAHVWLGVSAEDQATFDDRARHLLQMNMVAVRWLSLEPLLGPIDISRVLGLVSNRNGTFAKFEPDVQWVVVGGESGPGARPMHPEWARSLRDQCVAAGVPFFFKQWGEFGRVTHYQVGERSGEEYYMDDSFAVHKFKDADVLFRGIGQTMLARVGKKAAGRLLDGVEWNQFPEAQAVATA